MSLYNLLHGVNPYSGMLLALLGFKTEDFGRFRDVRVATDEDGNLQIRVHTRCGGGNRPYYQSVFDQMAEHPNYLSNADDDFDCTYCDFCFSAPEHGKLAVTMILETADNTPPAEKWQRVLAALNKGDENDPLVQKAREVMQPIMEKIMTTPGQVKTIKI